MALASMQDSNAIRTIGKYKILGTLGRGSMGVVYRAQDPEIGRVVAIKILRKITPQQGMTSEMALERFKIEARAAGNLRHPHIITVFDVNIEGDTPYIVMDFIEGTGLSDLISKQGKLDPRQTIHYLWQVASGLDHAHSRGIIHRDIKPSNILVDKSENVFILDFGVASMSGTMSSEEPIMGTPSYMSPEQVMHRELDPRSDLFSLAVVAFECLTGKRPFQGDNFSSIVKNVLNARPMSIIDASPELPLPLEMEFERALSKNKEDRFPSAEAMVSALSKALGYEVPASGTYVSSAGGATRKRKISDWRVLLKRDETPRAESDPVRSRRNTPVSLSPWRPEYRSIKAEAIQMTASAKVITRPGAMYSASEEVLEGGQVEVPRYRMLTAIFGVLCIVLSIAIFWKLFLASSSTSDSEVESAVLIEDIKNPDTIEILSGDLRTPRVEPVPVGKEVIDMNDRQILGILIDANSSDALTIEAIREARRRALSEIVDASVSLLQKDSYVVRIETLKMLAEMADKRIVPHVVGTLDDHDPLVRRWGAKTLAKIGDRRAIGYLQARLMREDLDEVKGDLRKAIEKITGVPYVQQ